LNPVTFSVADIAGFDPQLGLSLSKLHGIVKRRDELLADVRAAIRALQGARPSSSGTAVEGARALGAAASELQALWAEVQDSILDFTAPGNGDLTLAIVPAAADAVEAAALSQALALAAESASDPALAHALSTIEGLDDAWSVACVVAMATGVAPQATAARSSTPQTVLLDPTTASQSPMPRDNADDSDTDTQVPELMRPQPEFPPIAASPVLVAAAPFVSDEWREWLLAEPSSWFDSAASAQASTGRLGLNPHGTTQSSGAGSGGVGSGWSSGIEPVRGDSIAVTLANLHVYIAGIVRTLCVDGVALQRDAFLRGASSLLAPACVLRRGAHGGLVADSVLRLFTADELHELLCGAGTLLDDSLWTREAVEGAMVIGTHYNAGSPQVRWLAQAISELAAPHERRLFLKFLTGAPRLPPGGFGALAPHRMKIQKLSGDDADRRLPGASVCHVEIKVPAYSSYAVLKDRLRIAITEGSEHFSYT
jgi:hypothetical protein